MTRIASVVFLVSISFGMKGQSLLSAYLVLNMDPDGMNSSDVWVEALLNPPICN
jgi:hypothetical protein